MREIRGKNMRSEERSFSFPDSKDDCTSLDCKNCGLLVNYLLEDKVFTCFNPMKSHKILGCLM